jgi:hypothetical protein
VQRFTDGTPDAPSPELPPGSPYASMDGELLAMLGRTLTGKTLWNFKNKSPTNLGAALDLLGPADINTLVQLRKRLADVGMWSYITTISAVWSTSSLGVDFAGPGGMQEAVDGHKDFCKDTVVGEVIYHKGKSCWREMVDPGTAGLHVCLPGSVHIDPHQAVEKERGTSVELGGDGWGIKLGERCKYAFFAWLDHMGDVEGGKDVNVFTRFDNLRKSEGGRVQEVRQRVRDLGGKHADFAERSLARLATLDTRLAALEPTLRAWAIKGFEGTDGGADTKRVLGELDAIEKELASVRQECSSLELRDNPPRTPRWR